jgi:hypothetical protein
MTHPEGRHGGEAEIQLGGGGHRISLETMIGTISVESAK